MKIKEGLKWLKNISFYGKKTKLLQKHELCVKGKVYIMNFSDKGNVVSMGFWE